MVEKVLTVRCVGQGASTTRRCSPDQAAPRRPSSVRTTGHSLLRSRRVAADNRAGWSGLLLAASGQLEEWKSSDEAKEKFTVEDPFAEEY